MRPRRLKSWGFPGLFLAAMPAFSCSSSTDPSTLFIAATVQFVQVEGGCWTLLATDGARYEPVNLAAAFRDDGLEVFVRLEVLDDVGSTCAIGQVVEIENIRLRD